MDTRTLAANLRQAIAGCGDYHIERWGRELADRAEELQRVVDARQTQHSAARAEEQARRDTEGETDGNARETELQALKFENNWLRAEWLRVLEALGISDAERVLNTEDEFIDAPSTIVLRIVAPKPAPAMEENPERKCRTCESCKWFERDEPRSSYDIGWDGECHRYPEWSTHDDDDWCGEWEKRPFWCEVEQ